MSKLSQFKQTRQLGIDEVLAEIEAEECSNGLCPIRAWCLSKRIKISKRAMARHRCAFEEHGQLYQCPAYRNDGHERPLDRGDVMARCAGAAYCGDTSCDHAKPHRWDPMSGCHTMKCRQLEAALAAWNEETKGPPPEVDVAVVCETM